MLLGGPPRPGARLLPPATPRRAALGFVCLGWPRRGAGGVGPPGHSSLGHLTCCLREKPRQDRYEPGPGSAASLLELCVLVFFGTLLLSIPARNDILMLTLRKRWGLSLGESHPCFGGCSGEVTRVKGTWTPHSHPGTLDGIVEREPLTIADRARERTSQTALKWKEGPG